MKNEYVHYADVLAIPFFALLVLQIKNKSRVEYILLFFGISGLLIDSATFWINFRHVFERSAFLKNVNQNQVG